MDDDIHTAYDDLRFALAEAEARIRDAEAAAETFKNLYLAAMARGAGE